MPKNFQNNIELCVQALQGQHAVPAEVEVLEEEEQELH
jgi:hypothetical protein